MSNIVYPSLPGLAWPVKRAPIFKTLVKTTPSGREWRSAQMLVPRYRWSLQYEFLRSQAALAEFQALFAFFEARMGGYDTFLYRDDLDNTATAQAFGTGDGSTTVFGLFRSLGGSVQRVFALNGAPQIYKDGVLQSSGYSVDLYAGTVTFTTAPPAGQALTWSGQYYWRVRFESDAQDFEQFMYGFWRTGEVRLISVKP